MDLDIAIAVALAILVAVTTGLAGQLASTKAWHKWLFWGTGVIMVSLIGWQAYRSKEASDRNTKAASDMQTSLNALQSKFDQLWGFLNPNPKQAHVDNQSSGETPAKPAENKPKPKPTPTSTTSIQSVVAPAPSSPQDNSSNYYGSMPHVDFPPSNGVLTVVSQNPITSTRSDAPYQSEIVVQSTATWQSLKLALQCNGDLVTGSAGPSSGGMTIMTSQGLANGHPNIFLYEYQSASPPFSSSDPLKIEVWSKKPVSCGEVETF